MWGPNFGPALWLATLFLFLFFFFSFLISPSDTFLPPLTLFIFFFHLIFLFHLTISSQKKKKKKRFSKFFNFPLLISLNIFLDPCVLEHFYYTPIFGETHFQTHLFFAPKCLLLPMDPLFLLLMARNMLHHLNEMMRRGSFRTPRPMLHILT